MHPVKKVLAGFAAFIFSVCTVSATPLNAAPANDAQRAMLTLIEQAEKAFDAEQTERMARKVSSGEDFTLEDFLEQMQSIKKMGSLGKLLGMLPGAGDIKAQLDQVDDKEIDRVAAIIQSMTPGERQDPKILNGSRRSRIAHGAGRTVSEVNSLLERFTQAQKMMRQMGKGGMPGLPGMPGMGGKKSKGKMSPPPKSKKGRSGNPAKRAEQESGAGSGAGSVDEAGSPPRRLASPSSVWRCYCCQ
jgi:signal recognition particle subunit SRP54